MIEETAIRIAEALERIHNDAGTFILVFIAFAIAFWFIAVTKD